MQITNSGFEKVAFAFLPRDISADDFDELKEIFGEQSKSLSQILQFRKSEESGHQSFLFPDQQQIQLQRDESGNIHRIAFKDDHVSPQVACAALDALILAGHSITDLEIKGSPAFRKNARAAIDAELLRRGQNPSPISAVTVNSPTVSTSTRSFSMTVPQDQIRSNHAWLPETQGDLLGITSAWADYHYTRLINDTAAGKVQGGSPTYTARAAQVSFLDRIQSTLAGMQDEVTKEYPDFPSEKLSRIKKEIGPAGEDPHAMGAKEPDWRFVAQNLGIEMSNIAREPGDAPGFRGPSAPPPAFMRGGPAGPSPMA